MVKIFRNGCKIRITPNIADADDVDKSAQSNDKVLVYKSATGKHEYEVAGAGGTVGRGFHASILTPQSIPTSTWTELIYETESFDTNDEYDVATGRYTPQVEGYYTMHGGVVITFMADGKNYIVRLSKNGVGYSVDRGNSGKIDAWCGGCASGVMYMNGTTDYASVFAHQSDDVSRDTGIYAGYCVFSGWLLPAPS